MTNYFILTVTEIPDNKIGEIYRKMRWNFIKFNSQICDNLRNSGLISPELFHKEEVYRKQMVRVERMYFGYYIQK